ncbi:hypothetical protein [Siphonobacter sp. SORGH_AS_1065]|uniref:hypothetical protein n=1 Tax=Siphonobacter sp. SORGH_AS_1065 TaxID=3041795 RepID=UPI0027804EC8|nr:hypothetical protein [Siphonobacter sp. SORGH_AS_1065]MDQ1087183.1 hypothetical protein [Siphonobacter sp. SORGH_AS_1065]
MYTLHYSSNFESVVQIFLDDLNKLEAELPQILTGAALDHVAVVKQRIQNQGIGSSGQSLTTKAAKRLGAYSKAYSRRRQKYGRQTAKVDLTMSGDLMRSFQVMPAQQLGSSVIVEAGFTDAAKVEIARGLEDYYGKAFYPTIQERRVIVQGVVEAIRQRIRQGRL